MQIFVSGRYERRGETMQACEVRLWSACTDDFGDAESTALSGLLDLDELTRRDRLRNDGDRRAFVLAHALRRLAIAETLGVQAGEIRFTVDKQGKPGLAWPLAPELSFSLSHSRQAVVCAVSNDGEVGVDAEFVQGEPDFSLLEPFLVREPGDESTAQFFFYWTALEAFWKARGVGLDAAHPRIRVCAGRAGTFDASFEHDAQGVRRARLLSMPPRAGCAITVAVREPAPQCHLKVQ